MTPKIAICVKLRLHDTTCCQTGCIVYTNIQPVVKPVVQPAVQLYSRLDNRLHRVNKHTTCCQPVLQPVLQPVVSCKRGITLSTRCTRC